MTQKIIFAMAVCALSMVAGQARADKWVGTWTTAEQLVEQHNLPPAPGLSGNSLRQIVQVSIGGQTMRLKLSNEFSSAVTEINSVQIATALSSGHNADIDEATATSVTFNGSTSVKMAAGQMVTSDPISFPLSPRQNVAITIHYGNCSNSVVTGHPGSRTTSYLAEGNTDDFTSAAKTEHWYSICGIDVKVSDDYRAVAILGNSITDGRGSTTNEQNRWADNFSRMLLENEATNHVGVLNLGIGGNCVLSGGLGPTAVSRFHRDCIEQAGVKYIILFEGVNDLGYSRNGEQTAANIISAYKNMIDEAHKQGIWVYGATITPFKNSSYSSDDHETGRRTLNTWIRTAGYVDGVIDFDKMVRNPSDTTALQSQFLYQNDWLHPNALGYEVMGNGIDLNLFTRTDDPEYIDPKAGTEQVWIEAEEMIDKQIGTDFKIVNDARASGGKYLETVVNNTSLPASESSFLHADFTVSQEAQFFLYARLNCPTYDDDSYYIKIDDLGYYRANGLSTNGQWQWLDLGSYVDDAGKPVFNLSPGQHRLSIASRENGACIDRICISSYAQAPTGLGDKIETGILSLNNVLQTSSPVYSLHGHRLSMPQSGLNVIGSRKILYK
ncbi:MAG: SGNH/GDSL hydrolase family protein [Prevotella sp.]|nr:SGNH/GDSL hydrolase family protein [Prevotella sp.]